MRMVGRMGHQRSSENDPFGDFGARVAFGGVHVPRGGVHVPLGGVHVPRRTAHEVPGVETTMPGTANQVILRRRALFS